MLEWGHCVAEIDGRAIIYDDRRLRRLARGALQADQHDAGGLLFPLACGPCQWHWESEKGLTLTWRLER